MTPRDLYPRYRAAARALTAHDTTCAACARAVADASGRTARCAAGARLDEVLARLQAAYLTHLKSR